MSILSTTHIQQNYYFYIIERITTIYDFYFFDIPWSFTSLEFIKMFKYDVIILKIAHTSSVICLFLCYSILYLHFKHYLDVSIFSSSVQLSFKTKTLNVNKLFRHNFSQSVAIYTNYTTLVCTSYTTCIMCSVYKENTTKLRRKRLIFPFNKRDPPPDVCLFFQRRFSANKFSRIRVFTWVDGIYYVNI